MTSRLVIAAAVLTAAVAAPWAATRADDKDKGQQDKPGQTTSPQEAAQKFLKEHDKNNDGSLSRDELPATMREGFADLDTNKDGKLSAEELKAHSARMVLVPVPVPVELVSLYVVEAATSAPTREDLQNAYDMLRKADTNNDGKLSEDEIKAAKEQAIQARVDAIFKRCDKNGDGKISKGECPDDMHSLFNRTDKNNNGSVTKDELKACCTKSADEAGKGGSDSKK